MSGLQELLARQKKEAEAKVQELEATTDNLRRSWEKSAKDLDAAREELRRIELVTKKLEEDAVQPGQPTIKEAVMEVLKRKPEGMTALEILAEINRRHFEGKIVRTSLSPQLSRLKNDNKKIILRGNRWFLLPEQPSLFRRRI
jgi:hypothetical protein